MENGAAVFWILEWKLDTSYFKTCIAEDSYHCWKQLEGEMTARVDREPQTHHRLAAGGKGKAARRAAGGGGASVYKESRQT